MANNLRTRLLLSHIALILFVIPLLGVSLIYVLESRVVLVNLSLQLTRQAGLLADFSADYPEVWREPQAAQRFVDRFRDNMTAQIMLVDVEGNLLASSDPLDQPAVGSRVENSPVAAIRSGELVERTDYSQNLQTEVVDIWAPALGPDEQFVGAVRLTHQLINVRERFQRLRTLTMVVLGVSMALGSLTALLLASTLERPIAQFSQAVEQMAGDTLQPVPEQGPAELRAWAATFNALVERLNVLRDARRQLLANLVHEIGRPLGALRAAGQALLDGAQEEPELREALISGIDAELATLERVLDDLTRFYQQDVGRLELDLRPTPLARWLETLLVPWRESARTHQLVWETEIDEELPTVAVDPNRLAQAVGNLLSNAIKFTPSGKKVRVTAVATHREVLISVCDTGHGISADEQVQVFQPFFRSERQKRLPEGMGLGLTIARDLVVAHGGRLELESRPGTGTCFTIHLPL